MRTIPVSVACLTFVAAAVGAAMQEAPAKSDAAAQRAWLRQLAGEWTSTTKASIGPDGAPIDVETAESARMVGDLWFVAEGRAEIGGRTMITILTLGFDPKEDAFVGSWIDTVQSNLWIYRGTLDAARKVLTLETTGPNFEDPTRTAAYRDAIELIDADRKVLTSSMRHDDGTWTELLRASYRRRK